MTQHSRLPWSSYDDVIIADAASVPPRITIDEMLDTLSYRPPRTLRRHFMQHGSPDEHTMYCRNMMFGSRALLRGVLVAYEQMAARDAKRASDGAAA